MSGENGPDVRLERPDSGRYAACIVLVGPNPQNSYDSAELVILQFSTSASLKGDNNQTKIYEKLTPFTDAKIIDDSALGRVFPNELHATKGNQSDADKMCRQCVSSFSVLLLLPG